MGGLYKYRERMPKHRPAATDEYLWQFDNGVRSMRSAAKPGSLGVRWYCPAANLGEVRPGK